MEAEDWNQKYQVGQAVLVTLANGKRLRTHTISPAHRVGQFAMIEVEAIQPGTILLSWCWPIKRP